jgi:hypothetical protein
MRYEEVLAVNTTKEYMMVRNLNNDLVDIYKMCEGQYRAICKNILEEDAWARWFVFIGEDEVCLAH